MVDNSSIGSRETPSIPGKDLGSYQNGKIWDCKVEDRGEYGPLWMPVHTGTQTNCSTALGERSRNNSTCCRRPGLVFSSISDTIRGLATFKITTTEQITGNEVSP